MRLQFKLNGVLTFFPLWKFNLTILEYVEKLVALIPRHKYFLPVTIIKIKKIKNIFYNNKKKTLESSKYRF